MTDVVIPGRFNGPPESAHGGYTVGTVARLLGAEAVEVRLRRPPPLERALDWDGVQLRDGDEVVAEARPLPAGKRPAELSQAPQPVSWEDAQEAATRYPGLEEHPFPTCFGCGPKRQPGDGLRLCPGPVPGRDVTAAPWQPHPSLPVGEGKDISPEVVWAALDCPGGWASLGTVEGTFVLGTMQGAVEGPVHQGEHYVAVAWPVGLDGRKLRCGSMLLDRGGQRVGWSLQTWIRIS